MHNIIMIIPIGIIHPKHGLRMKRDIARSIGNTTGHRRF